MSQNRVKSIVSVTSGNFFEMYDFMVYGIYASYIAETFFPHTNHYLSLMMSLAVFGSGFLMRPLGAILIGGYIDKYGRRNGLFLTLTLMAFGMLIITFTPSYSTLGSAAPVLVLMGRLIQGLSAGVEIGSVSVYLAEIAPEKQRGFYVSWQSASQQLSIVFAATIGYVLNQFLDDQQMIDFGWRIPFLIGCFIVPIIFYQRYALSETATFISRKQQLNVFQIWQSAFKNWKFILMGSLLTIFMMVSFYIITTYTPTYGKTILHLAAEHVFFITVCAGLSNFLLVPIMGHLSDKVGRLYPILFFSFLGVIAPYPLLHWLINEPSFIKLLMVEFCLSFIYTGYSGSMVVALTEMANEYSRTVGVAISLSIAAVCGGFTPMLATAMVHETQNHAMPALLLSFTALLALITAIVSHQSLTKSNI